MYTVQLASLELYGCVADNETVMQYGYIIWGQWKLNKLYFQVVLVQVQIDLPESRLSATH